MPFEIPTPTAATLTSVTPRKEMHGDDPVSAVSLGLTITGANTILDHLDGGKLRHALYMAVPDQEQLPGVEPSTPLLRARGIELVNLAGKLEGWKATFEHGIGDDSAIVLGGCKVDKFRVKPMEGGSVELMLRIGSSDIDEAEAGALFGKLGQEVKFTLTAPEVKPEGAVIDGTTEAFRRDHPEAGADDSGDLFGEGNDQHAGDFGTDRGDDEGSPLTSDDAGGQPGDGASDSEGGETDRAAAEFEAGLKRELDAAGVQPKGSRRGRRATAGAVE